MGFIIRVTKLKDVYGRWVAFPFASKRRVGNTVVRPKEFWVYFPASGS